MNTTITYNTSTRLWEARNERGFKAAKDKNHVLLYALKCDHPELYRYVNKIAQASAHNEKMLDRTLKAAMLLTKDKVFDGVVLSQGDEGKAYHTQRLNLCHWSCECEDYCKGGVETAVYGVHCKHTLAQLLAWYTCAVLRPYNPARPQHDQADFTQGMDAAQADRICDRRYQQALLQGGEAVLRYYYQEILDQYAPQLYRNAYTILRDERNMLDEIRSLSGMDFFRIFEIRELDGERYGDFWPLLYEAANNGQLSQLKRDLIDVFEQL